VSRCPLCGTDLETGLTPREYDVLRCLLDGDADKQIVRRLGIGRWTVHHHVSRICLKLGAANRTHAVVIALARGILDLQGGQECRP
jgi:DNA-binding CsgD family transcriptional regulator